MKDLISIIIPAHNEENYLESTIKSVLKNKGNYELIIICDSCEDKTFEIAKKYTRKTYRVYFKNISKTRNYGVKKSSGEILIFNDADTIISENYIPEISEAMKNHDYGVGKWESERGSLLGKFVAWNDNRYTKFHKVVNGNFFLKRNCFEEVGGFNEKMLKGEDTDLGEKLSNKKFIYLENIKQIPSERKYREEGFLKRIFKTQMEGLIYLINRKRYDEKFRTN